MDTDKKEQQKYDAIVEKHLGWSSEKEELKSPARERRYKIIFNILKKIVSTKFKNNHELKILDLGCGSGETTLKIAKMFPFSQLEGTDVSLVGIEYAKKFNNNANITYTAAGIGDREFLNKKKGFFDIVVFNGVLEHIKNDLAALNYIYDLCSDNAEIIILTVTYMKYWSNIDSLTGHYRRYEPEYFRALLQKTKFQLKEEIITGFPFSLLLYKLQSSRTKGDLVYRPKGLKKKIFQLSYPLLLLLTWFDQWFDFTKKGPLIIVRLQKF